MEGKMGKQMEVDINCKLKPLGEVKEGQRFQWNINCP